MKRQDGYITAKSGAFIGHFSKWPVDPRTGEKHRQQKSFKIGPVSMGKTKARDKLRERIVAELGITADSRVTLKWFIENRWQPLYEGNWRDSTKAVNAEHLKFIIGRFGNTAIEDMDQVEMQRWLAALAKTKSGSLVRHCRIFLRSIMTAALDQEYTRKNVAHKLRVPKLKAVKKEFLSMEQIKALLEAAKWQARDLCLLRFILTTALRPSELLALKWKDVDLKACTMRLERTIYRGELREGLTKTTAEDAIPTLVVPEQAILALLEWYQHCAENTADKVYIEQDDYIFPNERGGFLLEHNYNRRNFKELAKLAGIPKVNFQILRRTVATHAANMGSLKSIQAIMRHKDADVTANTYMQIIDADVRATSNLLAGKDTWS